MAFDPDVEIKKIKFVKNSSGEFGLSVPPTINGGRVYFNVIRNDDFSGCKRGAENAIKFGTNNGGELRFEIPNNLDDSYDNEITIKGERVNDDPEDYGHALTNYGSDSPSFHSTELKPDGTDWDDVSENYSETDTINISSSNVNFKFTTLEGRTDGGNSLNYQKFLKQGEVKYWDNRKAPRITNSGQVIEFFDANGSDVNAKITITNKDIKIIEENSITEITIQKKGSGEITKNNFQDGTSKNFDFSIDGTQKTFHKITWKGYDNDPKVDQDGSTTGRITWEDGCSSSYFTEDDDAILSVTQITEISVVQEPDPDPEPEPEPEPDPDPEPEPDAPTLDITSSDSSLSFGETATITFTFSENVSGFYSGDIDVNIGSISNFNGSSNPVFTATYTPPVNTNATAKIEVLGSSYTSTANGVTGTKATKNISVDTTPPGEPTLSWSASPQDILKNNTSTITFSFSESVSEFDEDSVEVSNGSISGFSGSGSSYTATLTPDTDYLGRINVDVRASSFESSTTGVTNTTAYNISITVTELAPVPQITITPDPNRLEGAGDTSTISINLSQDSTDFTSSDVYLDPDVGTLSGFTGSGDRYTVTYTPEVAQETDVNVKVDSGSFTNSEGTEGGAASAIIFVSNTPTPVTVYDGPDRCDTYGPWTPANYNPNAGCADSPSKDDGGDKDLILNKTGDHTVELDLKHFQGKLVTVDVSWSRQAAWENDFSFRVPKCSDIKEGGSLVSFTPYSSKTITKDNPAGPLNWRVYNIDGGSKIYFTSTSVPNAAPTRPIFEHQVSDPVIVTDPTTGQVTTTYTQSCVQIGTETVLDWPPCPEEVYITKTGYNTVQYVYSDGAKDGANDQYITVTLKATRDVLPSNRSISMDLGLQKHIWLDSTTNDDGNGEQGHSLYDYHYHSDLVRFRNPATGSSKTNLKSGGTQFSELVGHAGAKKPGEIDTAISAASGGVANLSS